MRFSLVFVAVKLFYTIATKTSTTCQCYMIKRGLYKFNAKL
ncbi:hypothetical protein P20495_3613 [Pseudoalteromonas sp. BSi20495]|nr:hypothetical protein P20495_3613 [Pseudoalteromonas sp. BSi20495]